MGGKFSKKPKSACSDTALHADKNHEIELQSLSSDSRRQVTNSLLDMDQEGTTIILESMKHICKNPQLFNLVEEYVDKSLHKSNFCMTLDKCLEWTRDSQMIIQPVLQYFEAQWSGCTGDRDKYLKMSEELKNFKDTGFVQKFQSIYEQQISMQKKLQLCKSETNKKLKSVKRRRKVSCIIFASVFHAVVICAVVTAAVADPRVGAALAAATSVPLVSMIQWFSLLWKDSDVALEGQKEIINSIWADNFVVIKHIDNTRLLVNWLEIEIEMKLLLQNADFFLRDEGAVRSGMEKIKKKLGEYTKRLEDLDHHIQDCIGTLRMITSKEIVQKMITHAN